MSITVVIPCVNRLRRSEMRASPPLGRSRREDDRGSPQLELGGVVAGLPCMAEPPRFLFEGPNQLADVMPDGDRFLVTQVGESGSRDHSPRLVADWFSEAVKKMRK